MNITRLNFAETLPFVRSTLQSAHYLAFDLEMSGIMTEQLTSPSLVDSYVSHQQMQKRYQKQRQSVGKFIPLQFGLAAFKILPEQRKILAQPFNFYIFPLTQQQEIMKFSFHAGTMNFLTKNNFDFNKLFYEGVPFTSRQKIRELAKNVKLDQIKLELRRLKQMKSPQTQAFLKLNMPLVQQWMHSGQLELSINIEFVKYQCYMTFKDKIQEQYPQQPFTFAFNSQEIIRRSTMTIKKCTSQQKINSSSEINCAVEPDKMFNQVIDEMISLKKPIIVHNGFLDLMHVYYRFIEDLPHHWTQYKQKVQTIFPTIYDNKYLFGNSPYLAHQLPNRQTGLQNCFTGMKEMDAKNLQGKIGTTEHKNSAKQTIQPIKIEFGEQFKEYKIDSLACHQAGYDAFMTGYSFLKGITSLNKDLTRLTDQTAFDEEHSLIKNRVPQGSIKVPFNFQANDQDIYIKDGNDPLFFKSLYNEVVPEAQLLEFFTKNYGPVNLLWTSREMTEFSIFFVNNQSKTKYEQHLTQNSKPKQITADEITGVQFLVFTREQHQRTMNNFIHNQMPETQKI